MQPRISNFFTLKVSPHILFALTSSPQTFVAVAELVRTSGTIVLSAVEATVACPVPPPIVPNPPVCVSGITIPQS